MRPTVSVSGSADITRTLNELESRLQKKLSVFVGLPKATGAYEDGTSIAVIGAVQEFGSADGHIPERSFLRMPLASASKELGKIFEFQVPKIVSGELTLETMLNQVGLKAVSICQEAISAGIDPANSESTVKKKGSSTPLIDTGALRQSITYVVDGGDTHES